MSKLPKIVADCRSHGLVLYRELDEGEVDNMDERAAALVVPPIIYGRGKLQEIFGLDYPGAYDDVD